MTTKQVFIIASSLEEDRPQVEFDHVENATTVDWLKTGEILDGNLDALQYEPPHLIVHHSDATIWDFFRCAGTFGIISNRAATVLRPHAAQCFEFLPAYINKHLYFMIRKIGSLNVLDREKTIGKVFPHDPSRFMRIFRYSFQKSELNDPCLFAVPQAGYRIFGTDSIEEGIRVNNLRGFRLFDAEVEE